MPEFNCPDCETPLEKVEYRPTASCNEEQFMAVRAGDYFCRKCKSDVAHSGFRYFWKRDLIK